MKALIWFRKDIRVTDNTALLAACKQADEGVIGLFILTPSTWQQHSRAACQIEFLLANLADLSANLKKFNIPLLIKTVDSYTESEKVIEKITKQHKVDALFFNKEYEYDEWQRDLIVAKQLKAKLAIHSFDDQVIAPPKAVLSAVNEPLKVFTPYKKRWLAWVQQTGAYLAADKPKPVKKIKLAADKIPRKLKGFTNKIDISDWPVGETAAKRRLSRFVTEKVADYKKVRDFPVIKGTSQLSAYLALGILSPRQCVTMMLDALDTADFSVVLHKIGYETWLSELIWREFYKQIAFHFPHVCLGKAFKTETDRLPWKTNEKHFSAWCEGQTGIPLIDAAMRCLVQTGWMHNRLRMVVAMFLTKNLFIDWRQGEEFFMRHLIDGDFTANNGGWQWSASTGTDAAPYFRVFNPLRQSERFDPEGEFIKQYCPELRKLDSKQIHQPDKAKLNFKLDYPDPLVDLSKSRQQAIDYFKKLK